jgi:hypothetical protein
MPPGSSKKQHSLKVASITSVLSQSSSDTASILEAAQRLHEALGELTSSGSCPVAHVGAVLQAACWGCRALQHPEAHGRVILLQVVTEACQAAFSCLAKEQAVPLQQLRPVLRPCKEDAGTPGVCWDEQWPMMKQKDRIQPQDS